MPPERQRIIAVGDDRDTARLVLAVLQHEGLEVALAGLDRAPDLESAAGLLVDVRPDPLEAEGLIARARQEWPNRAIAAIVPRGDTTAAVAALDAGADDYIFRPIDPLDLRLRMQHLLAIVPPLPALGDGRQNLVYEDPCLQIDLSHSQATVTGRSQVPLTDTERRLLGALVGEPGRVLSHGRLLGRVWGPGHGDATANLHVYVNQVRRKIEPDPLAPVYLETHRGIGYRFAPAIGGSLRRS